MMNLLRGAFAMGVIAVAVMATGAFFSDEEVSQNNTFTAGAIDLLVDSEAHYAGLFCNESGVWEDETTGATSSEQQEFDTTRPDLLGQECNGTWESTDLGPSNTFFNLGDLKPGDEGENTISLYVDNNDAYMCAIVDNMHDDDNGLTEPEEEAGDATGGLDEGELSSELRFFAWADNSDDGVAPGNNIWNDGEEVLFSNVEGPASDVLGGVSYPMYTPDTGVFPGGESRYVGLYWCYGNLTVDQNNNTLECDGEGGTNLTQTDSMSADISFYVEQARNNPDFTCPQPDNQERVLVGAVLSAYEAPTTCNVTVDDTNQSLDTIQEAVDAAGATETVCVPDGSYPETVVINKALTLASENGAVNTATIEGGVNVKASDVTVTGFIVNPGQILGENVAFYLDGGISDVDISYNDIDGNSESPSRGVLAVTGGTYTNVMVGNNLIHDFVTGIYTNPGVSGLDIQYNDIYNNTAGIGGYTGAYVAYNEFTGGGEAIGADSSYDGSTVEFNNFLDGSMIIAYSIGSDIQAPNNYFGPDGGATQAPTEVDYMPEAGSAYPHN